MQSIGERGRERKTTKEANTMSMSSCFMLPMEKPFQVDRQIQHHWSRDNPFIPVRIEEEEDYIENNET